ncbi:MAG TPA: hypothetical protein VFE13_11040 [Caulobacteraceae bacterium]|nr:hypothetical protein [Caulobacteraceae bacterium]
MDDRTIEWLIVLCFPNGGSTALAKLLLTAPGAVALRPNAEGQWLIPAMHSPLHRWNPDTPLDYAGIRRRWMQVARRQAELGPASDLPPLVIEKSPPNACRYRPLVSMLSGMPVSVVAMTREPYATCASWDARYGQATIDGTWGWVRERPIDEDSYFEALAGHWLQRAAWLEAARADAVAFFSYEDFADRTQETLAQLARSLPRLAAVDHRTPVGVKDYPEQTIRNMNLPTIATLTQRRRVAIMRGLSRDPELVRRLGYALAFEQAYPAA